MNRLKGVLARAGLIELSAEEKAALDGGITLPTAPEPSAPLPPPVLSPEDCQVVEQRALTDIFQQQGVAPSPYPAERMLKVLEGLKAMDPASRRIAVEAMDAADDAWTLADVLLDAQNKIQALQQEQVRIKAQADGAMQNAQCDLKEREEREQRDVAEIRGQIKQLELLLEREIAKASDEKTAIIGAGRAAQDAALRETARLEGEIRRLQEISETFTAAGSSAASH